MRDCPNCSEQIQDEAVYCRHCHTELEPPLWLTSMRRCPYCAEWVENDLERCRYCDKQIFAAGAPHAAPFVESSSTPEEDFTQSLRNTLLDDDSDEAAAIAAAAAEFAAEEPSIPPAGFDTGELPSGGGFDPNAEPSFFSEPQSDLRQSLSDEPVEEQSVYSEPEPEQVQSLYGEPESEPVQSLYDEPEPEPAQSPYDEESPSLYDDEVPAEEPTSYYSTDTDYVDAPAASGSDSSIWMAGSEGDAPTGTGPLGEESDPYGRSMAGTAGVSELRADVSGPPGRIKRNAGRVARVVIIIAALGAAVYGLFVLAQGPVGAAVSAALATDIPTETPIPQPTATLRPAPTLPPEATEDPGILPTEIGGATTVPGCVLWDAVTLEHEGEELCAYGVIKRWWAGEEIPFIAIFSEDEGTFAIIDRTTRHPVGPGSCILARGVIEVMGGTRPNIDAQGVIEGCPEE